MKALGKMWYGKTRKKT